MAKATLPTNFKDDILANGMSGKRRYNMIQNTDGTVSFDDVTDYTQVGSTFGAAQINATNTAVNNAADASKIIDDLDTIKANTQSGYIAGALAVKELNSNLGDIYYLGQGTSFNISNISGYQNFTTNNFLAVAAGITTYVHFDSNGSFKEKIDKYLYPTPTVQYNPSSGQVTVTNTYAEYRYTVEGGWGFYPLYTSIACKVYLVTGTIKNL